MALPDDAAESPNTSNPFLELGLAPTLEVGRIKRAYFAAVARHQPHQNAQAFQRIREAYEKLLRPGDRALAYLSAEIAAEEQAECASPYDQRIDAARSAATSARVDREKIDRFVALAETSSLARMVELCRSSVQPRE